MLLSSVRHRSAEFLKTRGQRGGKKDQRFTRRFRLKKRDDRDL